VAGAIACCSCATPAVAQENALGVDVRFDAFGPAQLDVLPGETVAWTNVSERRHTVTADDGAFDSGDLFPGDRFAQRFDTPGAFAYHCTVHAGMTGEIDVRRMILGVLPTAVVPAGDRVEVTGRTADPALPVHVERSINGTSFAAVAQTTAHPDGTWSVTVGAEVTADYRATSADGVSQTRRLLVSDRHVALRATRAGVVVTVTPSAPYARIMLQSLLRERFGWWPVARARLDYVSEAAFAARGPARLRAVLVDRDGWTPLATSPVLTLR
jgi:plastocyanin